MTTDNRVSYINKTFSDDAVCRLSSNLYIHFGGGGLYTICAHSLTPYYLTTQTHTESERDGYTWIGLGYIVGKLKPWATEYQIVENSARLNWQVLGDLVKKLQL